MKRLAIFSVFCLLLIASTACDGESSSNVSSETSRTQEVKVENGQVTIKKNGVTTT